MSDFEFKPIHKFFQNHNLINKIFEKLEFRYYFLTCIQQYTLPSNITFRTFRLLRNQRYNITNTRKKHIGVNNILQLLDICQSTILNEELSINNIISNENKNTDYFTKTPYFKPTFNISNYTEKQQKFLTMF